jgi:hypothetical protein
MLNLPESFNQFLTPEECTQIDGTLLPTRDRFSIRITVYSWRYLQQVSQGLGIRIADLQPQQITDWLRQDSSLQAQKLEDESFMDLFSRLLISALTPLQKISQQENVEIEALTLLQIISWFEAQVKAAL